ncbi:MAG: ABC transporter ATP-binding protein [Thaumarchaeota archaeon]|jgi:peptide/nickel transport system ATP-binding protein|nr:ABC transporter ATP-binding protein [Candidatus Geocrenenecus arthurdayi]MCL7391277.1 ABC transporter ATP-binding protein [Candidatus Geocrenenecus arthurdayi]
MYSVVIAENLRKYFPVEKSFIERIFSKGNIYVKAVDGISFRVRKGEVFGLVGESGSGKTTTGLMITGLIKPTSGSIMFNGVNIANLHPKDLQQLRKKIQMVFQDPTASLNPRMKIGDAIEEPLKIHRIGSPKERREMIIEALQKVGLNPSFIDRFPHELSGGQRQRVVIARAIILRPELIVADEPVAMVDVSVRAQILDLLLNLKNEYGLTYVFITHDLSAASYICDRIAVMYLGKIVELASTDELFSNPMHPYTKALISAVPVPDPRLQREKFIPAGEIPSPINPPEGCRFHTRCPYVVRSCKINEPALEEVSPGHFAACPVLPFSR